MAERILELVVKLQILKDKKAQDMVEYALMAGFVAVTAGAIFPPIGSSVNLIFSKVNSVLIKAAAS
jgi:Flp pilus assembly pilin Flp